MEHSKVDIDTRIPLDLPFDDANFYNPGLVAVVSSGDRKVSVEVAGDLYLINTLTGDSIDDSAELRSRFFSGELFVTEDEWVWYENRWFEFFLEHEDYSECLEGEVVEDYTSAIDQAISILCDEDIWSE